MTMQLCYNSYSGFRSPLVSDLIIISSQVGEVVEFVVKVATAVITLLTVFLLTYSFHCTWVTSEAYSSPSIVLSARGGDGGRIIFDDFREAYYWLRYNTPEVGNSPPPLLHTCTCLRRHIYVLPVEH